jgi:hypothetical protein
VDILIERCAGLDVGKDEPQELGYAVTLRQVA